MASAHALKRAVDLALAGDWYGAHGIARRAEADQDSSLNGLKSVVRS